MSQLVFESAELVPIRERSVYVSDQGEQSTCYAHATTRLITRLIKVRFYPHFIESNESNGSFDVYYNKTRCGNQSNSIFNCILDAETEKNSIEWENESLSALLFHYIYTCIIDRFGCDGGNSGSSIDFILKLFYSKITVEDIKKKLKYVPLFELQYSKKLKKMFKMIIKKLANIFKDIRLSLEAQLFRPHIFSSTELNAFTLLKYETNNSQMPQVKLAFASESIRSGYYYSDVLDTIKSVIQKGFYVLLGIKEHAILISDIDSTDDSLIIKNSWGEGSSNWTIGDYNLVENNRLNWTTLQDYLANPPKEDTSIVKIKLVFVVPDEMIFHPPVSSQPSSALNVMVTRLSRRVPIFSRFFGKGRKTRNKKYTKKPKNSKATNPRKATKLTKATKPRKVTQKLTY